MSNMLGFMNGQITEAQRKCLLFDEEPVILNAPLAKRIGVNPAIFVTHLNALLKKDESTKGMDGRKWLKRSLDEWLKEDYVFWTKDILKWAIKKAVNDGLVLKTDKLNENKFSHELWYSIDYEALEKIINHDFPVQRMISSAIKKAKNLKFDLTLEHFRIKTKIRIGRSKGRYASDEEIIEALTGKYNYIAYLHYLRTETWKAKRMEVLERDGHKCTGTECRETKRLHIHHLTYKNLGNEPLEDLITLCRNCHKKAHNIKD